MPLGKVRARIVTFAGLHADDAVSCNATDFAITAPVMAARL